MVYRIEVLLLFSYLSGLFRDFTSLFNSPLLLSPSSKERGNTLIKNGVAPSLTILIVGDKGEKDHQNDRGEGLQGMTERRITSNGIASWRSSSQ